MSLTKIKVMIMLILIGMIIVGAVALVFVDTMIGGIILAAAFISWCILSTTCPSPRWF